MLVFDDVRESIASARIEGAGGRWSGQAVSSRVAGRGAPLNVILKRYSNPETRWSFRARILWSYGTYIDNHRGRIVLADTQPRFFAQHREHPRGSQRENQGRAY
jgi:hypothetical protein